MKKNLDAQFTSNKKGIGLPIPLQNNFSFT